MQLKASSTIALKRLMVADEGIIEGFASRFLVDRDGDVIQPGAFERSIEAFEAGNLIVPLLLEHMMPIGSVTELREVKAGLKMRAQLALGTPEALRVFELAKSGSLPLSIGFNLQADDYTIRDDGGRDIFGLDLYEISVATIASNPGAGTTAVKAIDWRSVEQILRSQGGLSARKAKRLVALTKALDDDSPDDPDTSCAEAILEAAQSLRHWRS